MKGHKMPEMKEGGVNVTPLIDIVMCLIIFFMLVAKIGVTRGVNKDVKLPDAMGDKIKDMGQTLTLNILHLPPTSKERPQCTALIGEKDEELKVYSKTDPKSLKLVLKEFKKTHTKPTVIVRGDNNLEFAELEQVLMQIAESGITDTAYEVKPEKSP
jgi:biopolymer transport protein ExbD